ncbi:hypothetical protein L2E82_15325 [Cichorium intybus]|uniref:Uncharacterized protein n=1 Tax=Cichorium intybus TaxID=13427 RepID=A0ACB9F2W7_CICIN|nr:hypothetical protein L2E82_15325 [Cichorium intybus]
MDDYDDESMVDELKNTGREDMAQCGDLRLIMRLQEFKAKKGVDDIEELKLDEVRAFVREIMQKEIEKHAADGLGKVDYAVASGGAIVLKHSEPFIRANKLRR